MQGANHLDPHSFCVSCNWSGPLSCADRYEGIAHCPRCLTEPLRVLTITIQDEHTFAGEGP